MPIFKMAAKYIIRSSHMLLFTLLASEGASVFKCVVSFFQTWIMMQKFIHVMMTRITSLVAQTK